ncbi:MAG TPA: methyltransferase domain-containing protein [Acidimicrobiales bacterium]|nr:methyltransferase domain-containing protein [Acidimicrobiales bacterium]
MTDPTFDRLLADIDEEVRQRRASGDFPPSLERELDLAFDRVSPVAPADGEFGDAIKAADRAAFINVAVPTASNKPGVDIVKRVLKKLMAWYLDYLAQQVTSFGGAVVRALRAIGERIDRLEGQAEALRPAPDDGVDRPAVAEDLGPWQDLVVERLKGTSGRVLHAECGHGQLVKALAAVGVDAYGVDPRAALVDLAVAGGVDALPDDAVAHLEAVSPGGLAGLVLSGCVDRLPLGRQRQLVDLAASRLGPGGVLVLVASSPAAWANRTPPIEADLAPGRPLHAATWSYLLERAGFSCETIDGPTQEVLSEVPGSSATAKAMNANLARLEATLFGPASSAVVGRLPS